MPENMSRRGFLALATAAIATAGLAGCSLLEDETAPLDVDTPLDAARTLVTYFSVPETDRPDGMTEDQANSTHVVDGVVLGNTQYVAQLIGARTGAQLFRIETAEPLPLDHATLENHALELQEQNARPKLKTTIPNLAAYDTVFIGYPIWWYDLPAPMFTFLEQHDFSGKNIILFSTHGGSRLSGTDEKIAGLLTGAKVLPNAFTISRDDMDDAKAQVDAWLDNVAP